MSIPDHLIDEVRLQADILEVVGEHTRLKRSGRTFRGPCPLHGGHGPNFSVDPAKGIYKCFVCGEGGNIYTFLQKQLGMTFPEAVREVAGRVGIEIPDEREQPFERDPQAHLYEAVALVAEWYQERLWEDAAGGGARAYLEGRGISRAAAERFGLGWSPAEGEALFGLARTHGIPADVLFEAGLVRESSSRAGETYPLFRERLIFPIQDIGGRTVAFGGRLLRSSERFKYINSPETPIYRKGELLYGLGWSRGAIRREGTALVVEGYMDYISLATHGVENVAAALGTAMTPEQATLLARYSKRAILLYDSDNAGLRATFRTGDELLGAGIEVLVATLPDHEDPDSIVRAGGAAALRPYLEDAVDVLERKIQLLERRGSFESVSGTRRALDGLLPTLRAPSDEVTRSVYLRRIVESTGVPQATVEREMAITAPRPVPPNTSRRDPAQQPHRGRHANLSPAALGMGPERNLLLLLLRDESWLEPAAQKLSSADFRNPALRAIYDTLLHLEPGAGQDEEWLLSFPPAVREAVEELRGDPEAGTIAAPAQWIEDNAREILTRPYQERLGEISAEMAAANAERQRELLREKKELLRSMKERGLPADAGVLRRGVG